MLPMSAGDERDQSTSRSRDGRGVVWRGPAAVLACCAISVSLGVLTVASLPRSSPPSEDAAIRAAALFWLVAVLCVVVGVFAVAVLQWSWITAFGAVTAVVMVVLGRWTGLRLERAVLDGCDFGTGSGDQTFCHPPVHHVTRVVWAWIGAGVGASCCALALVLVIHRLHRRPQLRSAATLP
jgi:hypothetical protein